MNCFRITSLCALSLAFAWLPSAQAAYVVNVVQTGGNVVVNGSGTINLTALTVGGSATSSANVWPANGVVNVGASGAVTFYSGISGPLTFGAGAQTIAPSNSGSVTAVIGNIGTQGLYVPTGYVSGSALSGSGTFTGATLASLGINAGTYTYTWGSGGNADSFTVNVSIQPSSTPIPSSLYLTMIGILGIAFVLYRRAQIA